MNTIQSECNVILKYLPIYIYFNNKWDVVVSTRLDHINWEYAKLINIDTSRLIYGNVSMIMCSNLLLIYYYWQRGRDVLNMAENRPI